MSESAVEAEAAPPLPPEPPAGFGRVQVTSEKRRIRAGIATPGGFEPVVADVSHSQLRALVADPVLNVDVLVPPPEPVPPPELAELVEQASLAVLETALVKPLKRISELEVKLAAERRKVGELTEAAQRSHDEALRLASEHGLERPAAMRVPARAHELVEVLGRWRAGELDVSEAWERVSAVYGVQAADAYFTPEIALEKALAGTLAAELSELFKAEADSRARREVAEEERVSREVEAEKQLAHEKRELMILDAEREHQKRQRQVRADAERQRAAEAADAERRAAERRRVHERYRSEVLGESEHVDA